MNRAPGRPEREERVMLLPQHLPGPAPPAPQGWPSPLQGLFIHSRLRKPLGVIGGGGSPSRPCGWSQRTWPAPLPQPRPLPLWGEDRWWEMAQPTSLKCCSAACREAGEFQRPTCPSSGQVPPAPRAPSERVVGLRHRRKRVKGASQAGFESSGTERKSQGLLRTSAVSVPSSRAP